MSKIKYVIIYSLHAISVNAYSQLVSPKIFMNSTYTAPVDLADTTGQYGENTASIGFSVPVFGKINHIDASTNSFVLVMLNGEFEVARTEIGAFDQDRLFFKPWVGTSMIYHSGKQSTFIGNLSFRWMEDEFTGSDPRMFPTGLILWRLKRSDRLSYLFGATYTYNFGAGLPFPILGLNMELGNSSKLSLVLPLSLDYQKTTPKGHTYRLFLKPSGDIARFGNNQVFSDEPASHLLVRKRSFKFGISYSFPWSALRVTPEMGVLGRRSLTFSDTDSSLFNPDEIYKTGIGPSLYLKVKIRINLNGRSTSPVDNLNSEWMGF